MTQMVAATDGGAVSPLSSNNGSRHVSGGWGCDVEVKTDTRTTMRRRPAVVVSATLMFPTAVAGVGSAGDYKLLLESVNYVGFFEFMWV
ncbi:hypothetical protein Hanom_Chr07g00645081 [Helianthus anomalus]